MSTIYHSGKSVKIEDLDLLEICTILDIDDCDDINDAVDAMLPEVYEMDDLGVLEREDGIPWMEDGKYNTLVVDEDGEEDMEWIFPKDTPKGEKIPEFPQELKDFYDGKIYQAWKKVSPQAHQVVLRSHQVGVTGWRKFLDRDPPFGKL